MVETVPEVTTNQAGVFAFCAHGFVSRLDLRVLVVSPNSISSQRHAFLFVAEAAKQAQIVSLDPISHGGTVPKLVTTNQAVLVCAHGFVSLGSDLRVLRQPSAQQYAILSTVVRVPFVAEAAKQALIVSRPD
jgi:hypothetical protein